MARDYARKLEAMRAYSKTPAGRASHARYIAKRRESALPKEVFKANPRPLLEAIALWR